MAIKKINNYYLVDSLSDLNLITNPRLGAKCYVIETATNYTCNSEGKWFDNIPDGYYIGDGEISVDLSKYATKEYVQFEIANIEFPEGNTNMIALSKEEILDICKPKGEKI